MSVTSEPEGGREETLRRYSALVHSEEVADLRDLLRKVWRRKMVVFGTVVTLTTLAFVYVNQLVPRFTAQALVMINPRATRIVDIQEVMASLSSDTQTIQTEIALITSRGFAEKAINRLRLDQNPEVNAGLRKKSGFAELKTVIADFLDPRTYIPGEWLATVKEWSIIVFGPAEQKVLSEAEKLDRQRARNIDAFLGRLEVKQQPQTRVIEIAFVSENPQTATSVVNSVADLYILEQLEAKFEATERATVWLNERLTGLRRKVEASERAVEQFEKTSGLTVEDRAALISAQQMSELNTQLILARSDRAGVEARLRQVESLVSSREGIETATQALESTVIQALRTQETRAMRTAAELSEEYGERHPRMINARAEIRDVRRDMRAEVNRIVRSLRNEVSVAHTREASLSASLEEIKNEVGELNKARIRLGTLEREADANRLLFKTFLARFKETSVQEDIHQADARIISRADVPQSPSYPRKRLMLALALFGSTVLGVVLVFAIEMLDRGFRSIEQIERLTGIPTLGLVPALKGIRKLGKSPEDYIVDRPASAYAESIRTLHTGLLMSDVDAPPKVVMVVSALPVEGKTTICVSLVRMMALVGHKVVLVDADLRRPDAHRIFGVAGKPGLVEVLTGTASLDEVIRQDEKSGAHIVAAGGTSPNAPEILGSQQMKDLLAQLSNLYDLVVIDTPPLLVVSDVRILSLLVDKCVFVVRWANTRREVAVNGLKQLVDAGADIAGILLTIVDVRKHAHYSYGDSGYYYGRAKKYYTD